MNDLALYQLERAIDALTNMTKFMREDESNVVQFPTEGDNHSSDYYDYTRNDLNRENPFEFTIDPSMPPWRHSDLEYGLQYTDEEIAAMCDQAERDQLNLEQSKEQIYNNYRAAIDEYNKLNEKYEELARCHEELQDLFYKVDGELDELKVNYDKVRKDYHTVVTNIMNMKV